jgi:hypothetical protein
MSVSFGERCVGVLIRNVFAWALRDSCAPLVPLDLPLTGLRAGHISHISTSKGGTMAAEL